MLGTGINHCFRTLLFACCQTSHFEGAEDAVNEDAVNEETEHTL